jgi:hypothetical protein
LQTPCRREGLKLTAVPTLAGKTIESVTIVITTPVAPMLIAIRTAIDRRVPELTYDSNSRNIDAHRQIRVCLCRNAGTHASNHKSSSYRNR